MTTMSTTHSVGKVTAVLVVHGVGNPKPGETLEACCAGIASVDDSLHFEDAIVEQMVEARIDQTETKTPLHTRRARRETGERYLFAEVAWGRPGHGSGGVLGFFTVLRELFRMVTRLHVIVDAVAARRSASPVSLLVTWPANAGAMLLSGPVFAINLLLLVAALVYAIPCYQHCLVYDSPLAAGARTPMIVLLGLSIAFAGALVVRRQLWRWHRFHQAPLWPSVVILGAAWLAVGLAFAGDDWLVWGRHVVLILKGVFAVISLAMLATITGACLSVLGIVGGDRTRQPALAATAAFSLQFLLWQVVVAVFWRTVLWLGQLLLPTTGGLQDTFVIATPTEGLQWVSGAFVVAALVAVLLVRRSRARAGKSIPRLIVGRWILVGLFVGSAGGSLAYVLASASVFPTFFAALRASPLLIVLGNGIALVIAAILLFVSAAIRSGLALADDVLDYLGQNAVDHPVFVRPLRTRFRAVLNHVRRREDVERVVIFAHSQGSVIAIDELARTETEFGNAPVALVTMGSPITHLYRHYLPEDYPDWSDERWEVLRDRVARWRNLYREDDYVGTSTALPGGVDFDEQAVGLGGHTGYWTDDRIKPRLRDELALSPQR